MRNIIWRNRASAILGLMIVLLAFIDGFPEAIKTFFFIVLGGLIALFGFTSNRYASELDSEGITRRGPETEKPVKDLEVAAAEPPIAVPTQKEDSE